MPIKTKEELKRELISKTRQRILEKRRKEVPEEKTTAGFLSNLKTDLSQFSKGILHLGRTAIAHPIESAKTVAKLGFETLKGTPRGFVDFAKEASEMISHPIEQTSEFITNLSKMRAISYNDQKKFIDANLRSITASDKLNKEQKILAQFGTAIVGDLNQEITHPVEFMYDKPFTFGIDLLSAGGGKAVGKGVKLTSQMAKDTKLVSALSNVFIPNSKLIRAGYKKFADDLSRTSSGIFNMQEGIIKSTSQKFEKSFNLSGNERVKFFETVDKLRREDQVLKSVTHPDVPHITGDLAKTRKGMIEIGAKELKAKNLDPTGKFFRDKFGGVWESARVFAKKAKSDNPKIQQAIDWWLDTELPKVQKAAGVKDEFRITNYLHHLFPERVSQAEKAVRPIKAKRGFLKKSEDVAGFSKDPIVSISAIKIKTAMANIKDAFIRRTEAKYSKAIDTLETRLFGDVGPDKFNLLKKTNKITDEIKKRYNVDSFVKSSKETLWFPKEIANELNKIYGFSPTTKILQTLLAPLDFFNRNWKPIATAVRPRYHSRNIVGNNYNSIIIGKMNPKNIPTAIRQQVAGYINEARKTPGNVGKIAMKLFPKRLNDKYLRYALKDEIIGRGFFSIDLHDLNKAVNFSEDIIKTINRIREPAEIYKIPIFKNYLNLSKNIGSAIEDNARLSLYIDRLKKGYSRVAAKEYVNKHLFDYLQGLGEGDRLIKRFIPFWSWQRFNMPLQLESVFTRSRRMAAIQHGIKGEVRSKELEDESLQWLSEKEKESGQFKIGEVEVNGKMYDKYMRTQSVLPHADLIKLVDYFQLKTDDIGLNPVFTLLQRLEKNQDYWGNEIERFTGEQGMFMEGSFDKRHIEMLKVLPILNEINKLIGGSDLDKAPLEIRFEQVLSPLGVSLKDPEEVKYFGLLKEEQELKGSYEGGLESLYINYYSKLRDDKEHKVFQENVQKLEKLLLDKGVSQHSLVPLKIKAIKKSIQRKIRENAGQKIEKKGEELNLSPIQLQLKKFFEPGEDVRIRDVTRELWEMITPEIPQTPEQAAEMGYKPLADKFLSQEGYGNYLSADGTFVTILKEGGFGMVIEPTAATSKAITKAGAKEIIKPSVFAGFKDISSKVLRELEGKFRVSKQFVLDLLKKKDMKAGEIAIVNEVLEEYTSKRLPVDEFANKVKQKLLPLEQAADLEAGGRYSQIVLPDELRGKVDDYLEIIYESPIKTSAGDIHFTGEGYNNYFAHTRSEDLAKDKTRRVIELQSDLFQKGRLAKETEILAEKEQIALSLQRGGIESEIGKRAKATTDIIPTQQQELTRLEPYKNIWHERIIREEIKRAAEDGMTKVQFPTGKTAMQIEGLGETSSFRNIIDGAADFQTPLRISDLKVGGQILQGQRGGQTGGRWIITDILGDGKFKAIPTDAKERAIEKIKIMREEVGEDIGEKISRESIDNQLEVFKEEFDISGKVDTSNPIYKFYENTIQKYLKKVKPEVKTGMQRITDAQGVEWFEIPITKQDAESAIDAFSKFAIPTAMMTKTLESTDELIDKKSKESKEQKETQKTYQDFTGFLKYHPSIQMKTPEAEATSKEKEVSKETQQEETEETEKQKVIVTRQVGENEEEVDVNDIETLKRIYTLKNDYGKKPTIGNIDLTTTPYATSTEHVKRIKTLYEQVGEYTIEEMEKEFKRLGSQLQYITEDLKQVLEHFDITPGEFIAVVRQDSGAGTTGAGAETKNPGNIGNIDTGETITFDTWIEGSTAAIRNLAERKVEK